MEAVNSTAIRVTWKPPLQSKQHGQIRGYQVTFSRLENGEPRGQPNILDIALPEAQVLDNVLLRPAVSPSLSLPVSPLCRCLSCSFPIIVTLHCTFFLSIPQVHTSFPLHRVTRAGILRLPLWLRLPCSPRPHPPHPTPALPSIPFLPFATSTFHSQSLLCPARRPTAESILILRLKKKKLFNISYT